MKIRHLVLYTNKLDELQEFYTGLLGLRLMDIEPEQLRLRSGFTHLSFQNTHEPAYYHFAFNIPSNQVTAAAQWLKDKDIQLLPYHGTEIVDFPNWNAQSVYFYDPAHNIVELIGRRGLGIEKEEPFGPESFLCVSEMGLPATDLVGTFRRLSRDYDLEQYDGNLDSFCAVGDEWGLFILVHPEKKTWIPAEDAIKAYPFTIQFVTPKGTFEMNID